MLCKSPLGRPYRKRFYFNKTPNPDITTRRHLPSALVGVGRTLHVLPIRYYPPSMPKLSVYVADELWEKACQVDPLANRSQLVQRGLERLLQDRSGGPTPVPEGAAAKIGALRDVFTAQARAEYEAGYAGALEAAEAMPWYALEGLANTRFDTRRWIGQIQRSAASNAAHGEQVPKWLYSIAKTLGDLADPIGFDEYSFTPTRARIRGFGDALRAVWDAVDLESLGLVTTESPETVESGDGDEPAPKNQR